MPEAKVTLVQKPNFVKNCLPDFCLERSENAFLKTVEYPPVSNYSKCIRGAPSLKKLKNIKRVKKDQNIKRVIDQKYKNKRARRGQNKIKRGKKAHKSKKSYREAQSKNMQSSLTSGRGEVPVAYEDVKTCPEQNSKSIILQNMPAAGIMHASVQNTKSEAPTGHNYITNKILSIIYKVIPKKPIHKIQMPLIDIICTMLCPSDRHQYRLWALKGHLLYFIFKIAPFIVACGSRSRLWLIYYPLDQSPGAFESLALIMANIILSVQVAFDTELIRSFNAHTQIKPNNMGRSRLFYPLQYLRKLACILAYIPSRLMLYALERRLMLRNDSRTIIYHKIHHYCKYDLDYHSESGRGVRFTHASGSVTLYLHFESLYR